MLDKSARSICCAISLISALSLAGTAIAEEKGDEPIFKYKKELAITDKQETNLRAIISKIQDTLKEKTE